MAAPLVFNPYTGWVDVPDPDNIPPGTRLIGASDLLRYENALTALIARINDHETSLLDVVPDIATLITDLNTAEATIASQGGLITTLQNNLTTANNNIAALTRGVSVNSTALTMNKANRLYVHTGAAVTLTLPAVATHSGTDFIVKNRGSATITVSAESNKLWNTAIATSMTLGIGSYINLYCDGTFWNRVG